MVVPSIKKVGLYDFGDRYCTFSDNYGDDGGHDLRHRTAINQRAWLTWFCAWFMWLHPQLVQRHSLPLLFTSEPFSLFTLTALSALAQRGYSSSCSAPAVRRGGALRRCGCWPLP